MNNNVIVLDGSKGAGKSTIMKGIIEQSKEVSTQEFVGISLDDIRRTMHLKATPQNNEIAFQQLLERMKNYLKEGKNVVIDCGLNADKLKRLEKSVQSVEGSSLYKVFLDGDYEDLKKRVQNRDVEEGKTFNIERFDQLYQIIREKGVEGYSTYNTSIQKPEEVVSQILSKLGNLD